MSEELKNTLDQLYIPTEVGSFDYGNNTERLTEIAREQADLSQASVVNNAQKVVREAIDIPRDVETVARIGESIAQLRELYRGEFAD